MSIAGDVTNTDLPGALNGSPVGGHLLSGGVINYIPVGGGYNSVIPRRGTPVAIAVDGPSATADVPVTISGGGSAPVASAVPPGGAATSNTQAAIIPGTATAALGGIVTAVEAETIGILTHPLQHLFAIVVIAALIWYFGGKRKR